MTSKNTPQRLMLREALTACPQLAVDDEIAAHFIDRHGYRNALARVDRLQRAVHREAAEDQAAQRTAGFEAAPMIDLDDDMVAERMTGPMRVVAAVLVCAIIVILALGAIWAKEKTEAGIAAYQGEFRG